MMAGTARKAPGVKALGYVGFQTRDPAGWDVFLREIFGLERRSDSPEGMNRYRLDERHHRVSVRAGATEKVETIGWEVASREDLDALEAHLKERGVAVERGSKALAEERAVFELFSFENPDGMPHEAYFGGGIDDQPFQSGRRISGFVTGEQGLGHVGLMTRDYVKTASWYQEMLGLRVSDYVEVSMLRGTFMHCNGRHHSLAVLQEIPGMLPAGIMQHLMVEARSLEDVGRAYDTALERQLPIGLTLGQHANDRMTSFYAYSPSGTQIEYGHGGALVDADWQAKYYPSGDLWGHKMQMPPPQWSIGPARVAGADSPNGR